MKTWKTVVLFLLALYLLSGCAMSKHKAQIREGFLTVGLNRNAFLKEWGMPDKTATISSEEFSSFSASYRSGFSGSYGGSSGGAGYFKGKVPLDVWIYERDEVTLFFNGLSLVGWKTEKTREELKTFSKHRKQMMK